MVEDLVHRPTRTWAIDEVSRLSGVTSRTLRHYDAIGLLVPLGVAAGGRRLYGHEELLRLQQVLVLRELDVPLSTIAEILDAAATAPNGAQGAAAHRAAVLREHHARLVAERDRFDRLARTVARTLESLEGGHDMAAKDLYAGFDNSQYDTEARERWGTTAVDRSTAAWERMGHDGQSAFHEESAEIGRGLAALMAARVPVEDTRVQGLLERHHAQIALFWTPDAESYRGLGRMYVDDPRFTATYDAYAPGLAAYLCEAIDHFATHRLAAADRP
ncbi:MerR family transcriptional regulator [Actinotalea sp. K2]|uniref:MerR family transcriptional regulator n=1 Tax=Actinotalea sp. K2 TaxID=2939438 RepID=UPI002016EE8D|nr:MerR family transcriptional regulator [Actinotalea sp. K2]MCL3860496.1 MerR family transcriptional regulator [Actinotalea sp. K2]